MADPTGEGDRGALRLDFDSRLLLQFRGSEMGAETLVDARTGKNVRHLLCDLLRQSVFGRLAGYEDVNDADQLCHDRAIALGGRRSCDCRVWGVCQPDGPL
jgi:Transposase DDE domain group 1